jgi:hypothetical protein
MITVLADGDGRHRLEDATGRSIGWVRGRAIGFGGMGSEGGAVAAVVTAWPALTAALRRHYFGPPADEPAWDQLRLVHDGAYEWVSDGRRPLARLHRPTADRRDGDVGGDLAGDFAIEFVLPSYATEGVAVAVALVVGTALRRHLGAVVGAPAVQPVGRPTASDAPALA